MGLVDGGPKMPFCKLEVGFVENLVYVKLLAVENDVVMFFPIN